MGSKIKLTRVRAGEYTYGKWTILKDEPQEGLAVGNPSGRYQWNLYETADQSECWMQRPYLDDIRAYLETYQEQ